MAVSGRTMASMQVHICDGCESFVDERSLHKLTVKLEPGQMWKDSYNNGKAAVRTGYTSRERELCLVCATKLYDQLKLDRATVTIPPDALDNFQKIVHP